jgi:hypothetical protein
MDATESLLKEHGLDFHNQNTIIPSAEEKQRSRELHEHRRCPHCDHEVSIADVISMLFGNGWDRPVEVQHNDGSTEWRFATTVNPQTMRVIGCLEASVPRPVTPYL